MATATLLVGFGDAFHLVPRVLRYFFKSDVTVALGIGKLVTSITMMYYLYISYYKDNIIYVISK